MADVRSTNTNGNGKPVPSERKLARFRRKSSRDLLAAVIPEDEVYSHVTEVSPPGVISEDYQSDASSTQSEAYSDTCETGKFMENEALSETKGFEEELKYKENMESTERTQSSTPKSLDLQVGVPNKGQNAEDAYILQRREGKVKNKDGRSGVDSAFAEGELIRKSKSRLQSEEELNETFRVSSSDEESFGGEPIEDYGSDSLFEQSLHLDIPIESSSDSETYSPQDLESLDHDADSTQTDEAWTFLAYLRTEPEGFVGPLLIELTNSPMQQSSNNDIEGSSAEETQGGSDRGDCWILLPQYLYFLVK